MKKTTILLVLLAVFCSLSAKAINYQDSKSKVMYKLVEGESPYAIVCKSQSAKGDIVIPSSISWKGIEYPVTKIVDEAFWGNDDITSVVLPNGIKRLGAYCFSQCDNLRKVQLPDSLESMAPWCFLECRRLESIDIPSTLKDFEYGAFMNSGLKSVTIAEGVTSLGETTFKGCKRLSHIIIPKSVTGWMYGIFEDCTSLTSAGPIGGNYSIEFGWTDNIPVGAFYKIPNLRRIDLPNTLKSVGNDAFSETSISSIIIPYGVTHFGTSLEYCRELKNVVIPSTVKTISTRAFAGDCKLKTLMLPEGVEDLAPASLIECDSLSTIFIPKSVTSLAMWYSYYDELGCSYVSLKDVYVCWKIPPKISTNTFFGENYKMNTATLHVPTGCKEIYAGLLGWDVFSKIEEYDVGQIWQSGRSMGQIVLDREPYYRDDTEREYDNKFIFSLTDNSLSINGFYSGNPNTTQNLDYYINGHNIFLNIAADLDDETQSSVETQPLKLDVTIEGCKEDYYYIYLTGYSGKTAIVDDYTLHETSFKGYGVSGFVREKPPKTDITTGQKDPKESDDVDVVCRVRGIVGGHYQQRVRAKEGNVIYIDGTYNSQAEGEENVEAQTSLGQLAAGEYEIVLNVTDEDDVMPPFSATLTFRVGGTGIEILSADDDAGVFFDLQGNPVSNASRGAYIYNGKKIFIR